MVVHKTRVVWKKTVSLQTMVLDLDSQFVAWCNASVEVT